MALTPSGSCSEAITACATPPRGRACAPCAAAPGAQWIRSGALQRVPPVVSGDTAARTREDTLDFNLR